MFFYTSVVIVLHQKWFGFSSFRACQHEVLQQTLNGGDSLVIMATGIDSYIYI
jgi:superfamily II DNA helicase RecQ